MAVKKTPAKASSKPKAAKKTSAKKSTKAKAGTKASKKKAVRRAGEHPHTNTPRTEGMSVMQPHETPSGAGYESVRPKADAPLAGSAEAQPTAGGGPPEKE